MISFLSRSILGKIMAAMLGVFLTTYIATAAVVYFGVRSAMLATDALTLNQVADLKFQRLVSNVQQRERNLVAWSELDVMNDLLSGDVDRRIARSLESLQRLYGFSGGVYAFDADGRLVAASTDVSGAPTTLPADWFRNATKPVFLDRHHNPMAPGDIVAIEAPVFASFAHEMRTGTLVLTVPWELVEQRLHSPDSETLLVRIDPERKILMADPPELAGQVDIAQLMRDNNEVGTFLVGRSTRQPGLLSDWQILSFQRTDTLTQPIQRVGLKLALLGILLAIPIVGLVRWISMRVTTPVTALTEAAREIADTDALSVRAPVSGSDELSTLAKAFNRMTEALDRGQRERERLLGEVAALNQSLETKVADRTAALESAMAAQKRLIGDISHEIKSPLARLNVALGLAQRSADAASGKHFARMEGEIANISALAGELLTLARLEDGGRTITLAELDLGQLIDRIVADALYEMNKRTGDVVVNLPPGPVIIHGNAELLRRAIENVVRNALFYTAPGVPIEVTLADAGGATVTVSVRDHGKGVPEADLVHLFEPFYRVDTARSRETGGTGVGLAICQKVVDMHHGRVRARNCSPPGLLVELILPKLRHLGSIADNQP